MKKLIILLAIVAVCFICGPAYAETEILPAGAKVSATISGDEATITITGITPEMVEFYSHKKIVYLGAVTTFKVNLNEGYRFNFKFGGGKYALLTPEMASRLPGFFGPGIGLDCKDPRGCCFMVMP